MLHQCDGAYFILQNESSDFKQDSDLENSLDGRIPSYIVNRSKEDMLDRHTLKFNHFIIKLENTVLIL